MKLLTIAALVYLGLIGPVNSQDYQLPELNYYYPHQIYWPDSNTMLQKSYWDNGNLKIEYQDRGNGKKWRKEYFEEGGLKLTVEVKQYYSLDTSLVFSPETFEDSMIIQEGVTDLLDGAYTEYLSPGYSETDIPATLGQFRNGIRYGLWETKKDKQGGLISAYFNESGKLDGEYLEYYPSYPNKKEKIKIRGHIRPMTVRRLFTDGLNEPRLLPYTVSRRSGKWTMYDQAGNVVSIVTYKWKDL